MNNKLFLILGLLVISYSTGTAQSKRFDTSMKIGKVGYRVSTNNRNADKNTVTVNPIGFENTAREVSIEVQGRISGCEVDDMNNDGFPDLVLYIAGGPPKNKGSVVGISSKENQSIAPIYFPDIVDDPKIKVGYSGNDVFRLMEGTLLRRFPLYEPGDSTNSHPTGMLRQVFYRVSTSEKGALTFKVLRSYDTRFE